ncbi:uncharacterized protein LOC133179394 [Saccostrea echinata]|uniref:uncharacterized protein LOC133179394 n=1 Tax=Saccostrea echinata TaxID=191078 RepID=UPI002A83E1B3|nr:uncharacterized protein LOC133179394 [Saccostrea echinata]
MSLLLIKTQDLTWQDRALNMEVMLEPKKTQLLFKKNKTLSMRCEKDRQRYDKQRTATIRNYKTEKRYMDERNQELYIVKTQRFLQSIPPDMKQQVLSRRSFSISLTKLTKDINDETNARASAPPNMVGIMSREEETVLPAITLQTPEPSPRIQYQRQAKSSMNLSSHNCVKDLSASANDLDGTPESQKSSRNNTPIPSYLPSVQQPLPSGIMKDQRRNSANPLLTDRTVRFAEKNKEENKNAKEPRVDLYQEEKNRIENLKPKVQRKVNAFLMEQSKFNKRAPIPKTELPRRNNVEDLCGISKTRLVSAFDDFCELSNRDNFQKLVKYATKYKVASHLSSKIVPSVDTVKASRSFLMIQNQMGNQARNLVQGT